MLIKLVCLILELAKKIEYTIDALLLLDFEAYINDVSMNSMDNENSIEEKGAWLKAIECYGMAFQLAICLY